MMDHKEALNQLQLPELKTLCKELKIPTSVVQKADIIACLDRHAQQHRPLFGTSPFKDVLLGRYVCTCSVHIVVFMYVHVCVYAHAYLGHKPLLRARNVCTYDCWHVLFTDLWTCFWCLLCTLPCALLYPVNFIANINIRKGKGRITLQAKAVKLTALLLSDVKIYVA